MHVSLSRLEMYHYITHIIRMQMDCYAVPYISTAFGCVRLFARLPVRLFLHQTDYMLLRKVLFVSNVNSVVHFNMKF